MVTGLIKHNLISILICSSDRRKDLEKLIDSLKGVNTAYAYEIVVVEETDYPLPIDGIRYIPHPVCNRGIPYARNLALANAKGNIVVFLDDDCQIYDGWLDKLLQPFDDFSVVGIQGGVTAPDSTNAIGWAESILGFPGGGISRILKANRKVQETREISTLNCAYRKWVIQEVGGFDDRLKFGGEDYVFAKLACNYGRCLFVPEATVNHEARGSLIKIWQWFSRRGLADVDVIRIVLQSDRTFLTLIKSSLTIKLFTFLLTVLFSPYFNGFLIPLILLMYVFFQYARYFGAWRSSKAPFSALIVLPLVKVVMDIGMDWGRIRGLRSG